MYAAIEKAVKTITLSSYIFDNDLTGNKFVNALAAAKQKGVQIRVLVDDVGARYSWPRIFRALENVGIVHARFYPRRTPWTILYANLRNHRKLLVVDGKVGFTGGMNIRNRHSPDAVKDHAVEDMHFRLTGPIVLQLQNVFADDWQFATGEVLTDEMWFPEWKGTGSMICRAIVDGPDEHLNNVQLALAAAISCAKETVTIVTPYFIPDRELIAVLSLASMRGVTVDIVMPQKNNLFFVEWASMALRWQMLEKGCRMWLTKPPFDHSKLILIDGCWSMFGSSNWDARSLRLNFELNVECYDKALCQTMQQMAAEKISNSRPLTLEDVNNRPLLIKLRDGIARLFSPYL
jgi:cardiolipin synthase